MNAWCKGLAAKYGRMTTEQVRAIAAEAGALLQAYTSPSAKAEQALRLRAAYETLRGRGETLVHTATCRCRGCAGEATVRLLDPTASRHGDSTVPYVDSPSDTQPPGVA